jgi:hypothetical protein
MSELTIQSKNHLIKGEMISQELKANGEGCRRWIAIYPVKEERLKKKYEGFRYKVIDFELAANLVDEFFSEEDKKELKEYLVTSDIELSKLLIHIGVDALKFDVPWKNDYPL